MNRGLIIGSLGILAAAGGIATGVLGDKDKANVIPVDSPQEYDSAPTSILANDKVIYVVGLPKTDGGQLADSEVGRTVVYQDIDLPDDVLCPVLLDSINENERPNLEIFQEENDFSCFKIENSCDGSRCIFYCLLHGNSCKDILTYNDYLGSTMEEFINLDFSIKRRFLRKPSMCGKINCLKPIEEGDIDFIFPLSLARPDLSYMNVVNNQVEQRYEYAEIIDGGVQEVDGATEIPREAIEDIIPGGKDSGIDNVSPGGTDR